MGSRVWPFDQYWIYLSPSRDYRVRQQEGAQVHALHHLPLRSADSPDAVRWPAHLRCGDPLRGERPLPIHLPPLPPTRQGAAEPHASAAGNQPCGTTLYPHSRQWHQGGEPPNTATEWDLSTSLPTSHPWALCPSGLLLLSLSSSSWWLAFIAALPCFKYICSLLSLAAIIDKPSNLSGLLQ